MDNEPREQGPHPVAFQPQTPVPVVRSTAVIVLSVVVIVQTLLIIGLVGALVWMCTTGGGMFFGGMPSQDEQNAMMAVESMASDVGYYLGAKDSEGYLSLYEANDEHVDRERVESEFLRASETATSSAEYMAETYEIFTDEDTGETIVATTISGMNFETGRPMGGRLKIVVNADTQKLTGREGRKLKQEAMW
ncbi:MAG: hypothetical protein U1E22_10855 [Coriobacteriia bacterium]|nr:hypothetical protein [Coriobacteriia bacterium]